MISKCQNNFVKNKMQKIKQTNKYNAHRIHWLPTWRQNQALPNDENCNYQGMC